MAIQSDFFAALPREITAETLRDGPMSTFPTVSAASLTTLEMDLLLQIMHGGDAAVYATGYDPVDVTNDGVNGPWLGRLPDALRDDLATASGEALSRYAILWAEAEELAEADADDLESLLQDLAGLARMAQPEGKALYLWFSL